MKEYALFQLTLIIYRIYKFIFLLLKCVFASQVSSQQQPDQLRDHQKSDPFLQRVHAETIGGQLLADHRQPFYLQRRPHRQEDLATQELRQVSLVKISRP